MENWHIIDSCLLPELREEALEGFGFVRKTEFEYLYEELILDGDFVLKIRAIAESSHEKAMPRKISISTLVVDSVSGDTYSLHCVPTAQGAFVGKVREAHRSALQRLGDICGHRSFDVEYFFTIISYVVRKYRDSLEYPFDAGTNASVIRSHISGKWYAVIMDIVPQKIGLSGQRKIKIMNLHGVASDVSSLVDRKRFFPGFHMNKKYWYTFVLDGSIPLSEILPLVDKSRALVLPRRNSHKKKK